MWSLGCWAMRKTAAEFNLVKYVSRRIFLSARLLTLALVIYFIVLAVVSMRIWLEKPALQSRIVKLNQQLSKVNDVLTPLLYKDEESNKLIGVLPENLQTDDGGFYQDFSDLSKVTMSGLWLVQLSISHDNQQVVIAGATENKANVNDFINALHSQNIFDGSRLEVVGMKKGLIDGLTKEQKAQVQELKLPSYYRFKIASKKSAQGDKLS